ncbi:MAG: hypothetical protein ACPGQS_12795 [Bradymonadia bacterium]
MKMIRPVLLFVPMSILLGGCFGGPVIRYVVDVRPPVDRRQPQKHAKQDKGFPSVDSIRPEIKLGKKSRKSKKGKKR